jgi:hypothetical protein
MFMLATTEGAAIESVALITGGATVLAAVIVAGVAAFTTNARLAKQIEDGRERQERELDAAGERQARELTAEADRQKQTLRADRRRQTAALAHDRELADVADLRAVLDEATLGIEQASDARIKASTQLAPVPAFAPTTMAERAKDAERKLDAARAAISPALARVKVRLGPDDEIARSFDALDGALLDMATCALLLRHAETDSERESERADLEDAGDQFRDSAAAFLAAAVKRAGTTSV